MSDALFGTQTAAQLKEIKEDVRVRSSLDSFVIPTCESLLQQSKGEKRSKNKQAEIGLKSPVVQHVRVSLGMCQPEPKVKRKDTLSSNSNIAATQKSVAPTASTKQIKQPAVLGLPKQDTLKAINPPVSPQSTQNKQTCLLQKNAKLYQTKVVTKAKTALTANNFNT